MPRFPDVTVQLERPLDNDQNVFYLIGTVKEALVQAGHRSDANKYVSACIECNDFNEIVRYTREYVNLKEH